MADFDGIGRHVTPIYGQHPVVSVVRQDEERQYFLQHGLTIGRDLNCTICIDNYGVTAVHARVLLDRNDGDLYALAEDDNFIDLPSGARARRLHLTVGTVFEIGPAIFQCGQVCITEDADFAPAYAGSPPPPPGTQWLPDAPPLPVEPVVAPGIQFETGEPDPAEVPERAIDVLVSQDLLATSSDPFLRVSCPRCRELLLDMRQDARFCPHCGLQLPTHCPHWSVTPAKPETALSRVTHLLSMMHLAPREVADAPLPKRPALMAYANALFNLGVKYEAGWGGLRNMPQALRYYEKAAKLGVPPAVSRLAVHGEGKTEE